MRILLWLLVVGVIVYISLIISHRKDSNHNKLPDDIYPLF